MALQNSRPVHKKPGVVLIINCVTFKEEYKLDDRTASIHDVDRLKTVFFSMDFAVQLLNDPYLDEIKNTIHEVSQEDFTDFASLLIIVMSHGDKEDVLYCRDGKFVFKELLMGLFENENKSIKEIPKYVIIEACKGKFNPNWAFDSKAGQFKNIPNLMAVLTSSFEGFVSYMDNDGTPFIKQLCNVLNEYCKSAEDIPFSDVLSEMKIKFGSNDQQTPMLYKPLINEDKFTLRNYLQPKD